MFELVTVYTSSGIVLWSSCNGDVYETIKQISFSIEKGEKTFSNLSFEYEKKKDLWCIVSYHQNFPVYNAKEIANGLINSIVEKNFSNLIKEDFSFLNNVFSDLVKNKKKENKTLKENKFIGRKKKQLQNKGLISSFVSKKKGNVINNLFSGLERIKGNKKVEEKDLENPLNNIKTCLLEKNVAVEISEKIIENIKIELLGEDVNFFQSIFSIVIKCAEKTIEKEIPTEDPDELLKEIQQKETLYKIVFVGVNGVGKSTSVSKVCFWLMKEGFDVLIAGCDTFRAGAIEQLQLHVKRLNELKEEQDGRIELFEQGYGKEASKIAKQAVSYAKEKNFDVLLIDTAGRMQGNKRLMHSLSCLIQGVNPEKIVFVGETLVGNDGTNQIKEFNSSFKQCKPQHKINSLIMTKMDSVDDKIGASLTMASTSSAPILFFGVGQDYKNLNKIDSKTLAEILLK